MTIRITRNAAGNCLNFIGSSMPAYFNACLSGQVDGEDGDRVNVVNDIQTANDPNGEFRYEFFQIPYTEFSDKDGNPFASAQEAADYITQEGNVLGVSDVGTSLNGVTVNFRLDQTNTSVIMDNGAAFGVNTIKAVADTDGTIHIHAIGAGVPSDSNEPDDHKHFEGLDANAVQINGVAVPGGINDVVNALNELFTVGPFEAVVVSDPYSTMIADVNGIPALFTLEGSTAIDPVGSDIFANSASGNYAGLKSQATIDQAGEYFTFDIRVEGQIGFGLVHSDASFAAGKYQGSATYADPSTFAVGNSAHYGYQFSHWFHPTPNGSWTNYGASTGYVQGPGWSNWDQKQDWLDGNPVKIRVGINENGFIAISSLQNDGSWVLHARSSYPVPEGSEFHLGIKAAYPQPRVFSAPQVHLLEPAAPTLYFRYIESPDGYYSYPLFATQEEADYYEEQTAGAANGSHTHVYPDDPSSTTWYMPNTSFQMDYELTPIEDGITTFMGNTINWTEIVSLTNADLLPPAFTGSLTVNENSAVNYQTQPIGTTYTTTISGLPQGLIDAGGGIISGTSPYVSSDTDYTITVTRTNTFGSSQGQFTLTVADNPALSAIAGWTVHQGNTVSPNTVKASEHSVLEYNTLLSPGTRVRIPFTGISKFGIPNASGIANRETVDIFDKLQDNTEFDLLFTIWEQGAINPVDGVPVTGAGIGWLDNDPISQPTHENTDVYLFDYKADGNIWLTNEGTGEVLLQSATTYTGDLPLYYGTPDGFTQDKTIPTVTTEALSFTGDAISGFTKDANGEDLVDASTMADGSVVSLDTTVDNNYRLVIRKEWIEANISAGLQAGTGTSQFFVGIPAAGADWTATGSGNGNVAAEDFQLAVGFSTTDALRGSSWSLKMYKAGSQVHSIGIGGTGTNAIYDIVFSNVDGRWEMSLQNNYGTPVPTDAAVALRQINGGTWSQTVVDATTYSSGPQTIYFGAQNTTATLSLTGLEFVREPFLTNDILVGESSNGTSRFEQQPVSAKFDEAPSGHAWSSGSYEAPTLAAGQTYRFIYHPSMETDDDIKFIKASDGTDYTTGVTYFGSGDPHFTSDYKGVEFAVPADAPPLQIAYKNSYQGNTNYSNVKDLPITGSTYTVEITGVTQVGPAANQDGDAGSNWSDEGQVGWIQVNELVGAGERITFPAAFFHDLISNSPGYGGSGTRGSSFRFGFKDTNWTNTSNPGYPNDMFEGGLYLHITHTQQTVYFYLYGDQSGTSYATAIDETNLLGANVRVFFEITNTGNNIRAGISTLSAGDDLGTTTYADWSNKKANTGDQSYGITTKEFVMRRSVVYNDTPALDLQDIDFTVLGEVPMPAAVPATLTSWTKALDFSGSSERAASVSNSVSSQPIAQYYPGTVTSGTNGYTSSDSNSNPWATAIVFKIDGNNSNQHIWNQGEGSGDNDDNIYLRLDANQNLYFGWGRPGSLNECRIMTAISSAFWYGVYIAHDGRRYAAGGSTPGNLYQFFDIRVMSSHDGFASSTDVGTYNNWNQASSTTGGRMDRSLAGDFTIGGRGANRNFHGKVASFVSTTLKQNVAMPTVAEAEMMITDPMQWIQDYKVGQTYRAPYSNQIRTDWQIQNTASGTYPAWSTQVWLMGDGPNDSYANMIRNQVNPGDQTYTKLDLISMVSNDIENVNISGLS